VTNLMLASSDPVDHVLPHRIGGKLFDVPITFSDPMKIINIEPHTTYFTNHMLMTLVAAALMIAFFPMLGRRYAAMLAGGPDRTVPTGFANLIESMMQFVRENVARPVLGVHTDRFIPYLWTIFFYVLTCNLLGMIPFDAIVGIVSGGKLQHIGGTATANIMITAGLASLAFIVVHGSGMRQVYLELVAGTYGHHHHDEEHGEPHAPAHGRSQVVAAVAAPVLYVWNFAPHVLAPERVTGLGSLFLVLADLAMWALLLVLEFIGSIIKHFALAIRLFANMVAGHVVLATILGMAAGLKGALMVAGGGAVVVMGSAALGCLELFVAFLQAYIFTFLSTLFLGAAIAPEH